MLCSSKDLLIDTPRDCKAVGAFNISNLEVLQAIISAAEETGQPAIIALSEGALKYGGFENLLGLAKTATKKSSGKFAIHLDHGQDRNLISQCISEGFTSVMFDGSSLPFEENATLTRAVVEEARANGVSVEGELGRLQGIEDNVDVSEKDAFLTDPHQAREFVERTGVDALAVAIGTSHGAYKFKGKANLDFERLEEIGKLVDIPLVLHGASGVGKKAVSRASAAGVKLEGARGVDDESIRKAIHLGIRKINIDTDMRLAFTTALREILGEEPEVFDPRKILAAAREAVFDLVKSKMMLFSSGRLQSA